MLGHAAKLDRVTKSTVRKKCLDKKEEKQKGGLPAFSAFSLLR
jgi:hypothetical protein